MTPVNEIVTSLVTCLKLGLDVQLISGVPVTLHPMKQVNHEIQLAMFWLREAENARLNTRDDSSKFTIDSPAIPTMFSADEHLEYIKEELYQTGLKTFKLLEQTYSTPIEPAALANAASRIMEAYFNTQLTITYYAEIKRAIAGQVFRGDSANDTNNNNNSGAN